MAKYRFDARPLQRDQDAGIQQSILLDDPNATGPHCFRCKRWIALSRVGSKGFCCEHGWQTYWAQLCDKFSD